MLHFFDIELEMITSRRITALAVGLVTAAFSPVRGTVFNVTVGGPGVLRYDPPFIVCILAYHGSYSY